MEGRIIEKIWGLEKILSYVLMIIILDFTKPFEVHIDANDFVIGEVFM